MTEKDPVSELATLQALRDTISDPTQRAALDAAIASMTNLEHRNIQGAAMVDGQLWAIEHGPQGGDELNRIEPGANYGWPEVSAGSDYDGEPIPDPSTTDQYKDAELTWTPVISPSGMIVYGGDMFEDWAGHALIGGLTASGVVVVDPAAGEDIARIPMGARIREVTQAPDGAIWVTTDQENGKGEDAAEHYSHRSPPIPHA